MTGYKRILTFLFGAIMVIAGIAHFVRPAAYTRFIPDFLPQNLVAYLSGLLEIWVGTGVFFARYRSVATLGILVLMVAFLPLHILDVFSEQPAIGSRQAAFIRLPVQFVLIGWAWFIHRKQDSGRATP